MNSHETGGDAFREDLFFELSLDLFCIADSHSASILKVNRQWETTLGYAREELVGTSFMELIHPDDIESTLAATEKLQDQIPIVGFENRFRHKDGSYVWLEWQSMPRGEYIYAVARDITALKASREALAESEKKYRSLFDNMPSGFALHEMVYDGKGRAVDYRFLETNPAFGALTGLTPDICLGKRISRIMPDEYMSWVERYAPVASEGTTLNFQEKSAELNRIFNIIVFSSSEGYFATIFNDITRQKEIEERLRQSEKMEAIGQLAGGIAHDFNNQLTGIMGYMDLIRQGLDSPDLIEYADAVLEASDNAASRIRQLLSFARKDAARLERIDIHASAESALEMLAHSIDPKISLVRDFRAKPSMIMGDHSLIQNALLNLAINAKDAVPDGKGVITFRTFHADASRIAGDGPGRDERCLCLEIEDTGIGMDRDMVDKIFDPFFTTKPDGAGTGLGLAAVSGIVESHRGRIEVDSQPGRGTKMSLYFPLA